MADRYAYATGSGSGTVGCDPRTLEVRLMPKDFQEAAKLMEGILLGDHHKLPDMCHDQFTSVELKFYMGKEIKAAGGAEMKRLQNDKLNYHCDQLYSKKGKFILHMNSQEPWTPVVIASFGAMRKLAFQLVDVDTKEVIRDFEIEMKDGDVFLLCPSDEYPMEYKVHPIHCTAKWKHGVKGLLNDDDLSAAAMFRVVKNTVQVDRSNSRKILSKKDKKSLAKVINTTQRTGRKKRSTHFDQAQWLLADFMENQAEKIHQKIIECAARIIEMVAP